MALVKPPTASHLERDAASAQRVFVREEVAASAQKQGDVSGNRRTQAISVGDLQVVPCQQVAQAAGHELGFAPRRFGWVGSFVGRWQEQQLDRTLAYTAGAASDERVVADLKRLVRDCLHELGKERVDKGNGLGKSAKIFAHDEGPKPLGRRGVEDLAVVAKGPGSALVRSIGLFNGRTNASKDRDVGRTERVNRLFGVSDNEELVAGHCPVGRRQRADDFPLHGIGVLELVDQREAIVLGQAVANIRVRSDELLAFL